MTQMEWGFFAAREPNWRAKWYKVSPELREKSDRLNDYQLDEYSVTELSVVYAWLDGYEAERTRLGLDTPPESPPPLPRSDGTSGKGTNYDWGHLRPYRK